MTEEDVLEIVGYILYGICGVLGILFVTYTCTHTDTDCWLSRDPIICQKIKDGVK